LKIDIKAAVFYIATGILTALFFKDTAVWGGYCYVLLSLFAAAIMHAVKKSISVYGTIPVISMVYLTAKYNIAFIAQLSSFNRAFLRLHKNIYHFFATNFAKTGHCQQLGM